jgi:hypothetical protein
MDEEELLRAYKLDGGLKKMIMDLWAEIKAAAFTPENSVREFKNAKFCDLGDYHFGLGLHLRNNILTGDSEIYAKFKECGITERDEMSAAMIKLWYLSVQRE